jgi:hypothetical protein
VAPHGIDKIVAAFGNIHNYIGADEPLGTRWQSDFLAAMSLPFPLRLAWDLSRTILEMTCHRFAGTQEGGLQAAITSLGGCFAFRPQSTGRELSAHSWGLAIDLDSESNAQDSSGNMERRLVEIFVMPASIGEGTGTARLGTPRIPILHPVLRADGWASERSLGNPPRRVSELLGGWPLLVATPHPNNMSASLGQEARIDVPWRRTGELIVPPRHAASVVSRRWALRLPASSSWVLVLGSQIAGL